MVATYINDTRSVSFSRHLTDFTAVDSYSTIKLVSSYLDNLLGIQVSIIVEAKVSCISLLKVKIAWNAIL